jgi:hypothetical protein
VVFGCNETRSVPPDQVPSQTNGEPRNKAVMHDSEKPDPPAPPKPLVSPVYAADIVVVENALIRTINSYMHHVDSVDRKTHTIRLIDDEFWVGNTESIFTLVKQPDGRIRVDGLSHSHGNPSVGGVREHHVLEEIFQRLDAEMLAAPPAPTAEDRLRELERLHDQHLIIDDEYNAKRQEILKVL